MPGKESLTELAHIRTSIMTWELHSKNYYQARLGESDASPEECISAVGDRSESA